MKVRQLDPRKLVKAREDAALSQADAAEKIGIGESALSNYESGYARPQPHVLAALCEVYGVENALDLFSVVSHPDEFSTRKKLQHC